MESPPFSGSRTALKRMNNNEKLYHRMLAIFLQQIPELHQNLSNAVQAGNIEEARLTAHTLKSSAANVGAEKCRIVLQNIETACKKRDTNKAHLLLTELGAQIHDTIHRLEMFLKST